MIYLAAAIAALLIGLIATRKITAVFLEQLHLLWLMIPAVILFAAPFLIIMIRPELLMADGNHVLKLIILMSHSILLLLLLINIVVHLVGMFRKKAGKNANTAGEASKQGVKIYILRSLLILSLLVLMGAVGAHGLVLYANDGIMPVSQDYLTEIDDPVLVEGIRNDAMYFKRLIKDDTSYEYLGQVIPVPWLEKLLPQNYLFISWPEIIMASGIFTTILIAMLLDRAKSLSIRKEKDKSDKQGKKRKKDKPDKLDKTNGQDQADKSELEGKIDDGNNISHKNAKELSK